MDWLRREWARSSTGRWFYRLTSREQWLVRALVAVVAVAFAYLVVVEPIVDYRHAQVERWRAEASGVAWIEANREQVATLDVAAGGADESTRLSTINTAAEALDIPLRSIRPEASGGFSIRIEGQEFNAVLTWIATLNDRHGLQVANAQIDFHSAGRVDAQFTVI